MHGQLRDWLRSSTDDKRGHDSHRQACHCYNESIWASYFKGFILYCNRNFYMNTLCELLVPMSTEHKADVVLQRVLRTSWQWWRRIPGSIYNARRDHVITDWSLMTPNLYSSLSSEINRNPQHRRQSNLWNAEYWSKSIQLTILNYARLNTTVFLNVDNNVFICYSD